MDNQIIPVASPNSGPATLPTDTTTYSLRRRSFPGDFVFGASSSAYQYEGAANIGGKSPSIWDTLTERNPDKILDKSNGFTANDSYHRYKEDVALVKKLGLNAYRISISWPRILPTGKPEGGVNREGVDFYNNLIDELLANGVEPWVTVFHWDLPQVLQDEYLNDGDDAGFLSRKFVEDYCNYARVCFWEFGDRVKHWITLNEPQMFCSGVYGLYVPNASLQLKEKIAGEAEAESVPVQTLSRCNRFCVYVPPTKTQESAKRLPSTASTGDPSTEPYRMAHYLLLAHAAAVKLYRQKFKAGQKGQIGITLNTNWYEPLNERSLSDKRAAARALDFTFGWFMDPLTTGQYPATMTTNVGSRLPEFTVEESEAVVGSFDFLGLNYYTSSYATDLPRPPNQPPTYDSDSQVKLESYRHGIPIGEKGTSKWVFCVPQGLYCLFKHIKQKYNNPFVYVTENGVDQASDLILSTACDDKFREKYIKEHLIVVLKAIDEDTNVKGYMTWTLLDDFEWVSGYTSCFGLFNIDYRNGIRRYPKNSAIWYMSFLKEDYTLEKTRKRSLPFDDSTKIRKKV